MYPIRRSQRHDSDLRLLETEVSRDEEHDCYQIDFRVQTQGTMRSTRLDFDLLEIYYGGSNQEGVEYSIGNETVNTGHPDYGGFYFEWVYE